jgi:hypothetical protein
MSIASDKNKTTGMAISKKKDIDKGNFIRDSE